MQTKIDNNDFVEWCTVHGNLYGTEKIQIEEMEKEELIPILDIDIQGTEKFLKVHPEANTLFLFPGKVEDLRKRLIRRKTETEESLELRMKNAHIEMKRGIDKEDPLHLIGYRVINDDLQKAIYLFNAFIDALYPNELKATKEFNSALADAKKQRILNEVER